jgi:hypothetical protein
MSSLRRTFEVHAEAESGCITSDAAWTALIGSLDASGDLVSSSRRALVELGTQGRFQSLGTGATMSDVLACVAAVDDVSDSVDQSVVDVQHDVAALKRFSDYIVEQFDSESPQHAGLQRSLGDVAEAFRSTLANVLQRSLSDVALIEKCRNRALLRSASLAGSQACDPFAFQRQHARAIQVRGAAIPPDTQTPIKSYACHAPCSGVRRQCTLAPSLLPWSTACSHGLLPERSPLVRSS